MIVFFKEYWWIILIILVGLFVGAMKELNKLSFESYLKKKQPSKIQNKNNKQDKK